MPINESNLESSATITKLTPHEVTITVLNQKIVALINAAQHQKMLTEAPYIIQKPHTFLHVKIMRSLNILSPVFLVLSRNGRVCVSINVTQLSTMKPSVSRGLKILKQMFHTTISTLKLLGIRFCSSSIFCKVFL